MAIPTTWSLRVSGGLHRREWLQLFLSLFLFVFRATVSRFLNRSNNRVIEIDQATETSVGGVPLAPSAGGDVPSPSVGSHSSSPSSNASENLNSVSTASSEGSGMLVNIGNAVMALGLTASFYLMFTPERLKTAAYTLCLCYLFGQASALCGLWLRSFRGVVGRREDPRPEDNQAGGIEPNTEV